MRCLRLVATVCLGLACSGSDATTVDGGADTAKNDSGIDAGIDKRTAYAEGICRVVHSCELAAGTRAPAYGSVTICLDARERLGLVARAFDNPLRSVDDAALDACLRALEEKPCSEWLDVSPTESLCAPSTVAVGKGAADACCFHTGDCQSGHYCTQGKCKAHVDAGGACFADIECAPGTYCNRISDTCVATLADEAACGRGAECTSGFCIGFKCAAERLTSGQPCAGDSDCQNNLYCPQAGSLQGQCTPFVNAGGACEISQHFVNGCKWGLTCVDKTCQAAAGLGEACTDLPCVDTLRFYCSGTDDVCKLRRSEGEQCTVDPQCLMGLVCSGDDICTPTRSCV